MAKKHFCERNHLSDRERVRTREERMVTMQFLAKTLRLDANDREEIPGSISAAHIRVGLGARRVVI